MNVPPWGCPFHGLVRNGQLQLPNGQAKTWPQPVRMRQNQWDEPGYTYPVRMPNVAPVERSPDELSADQARGIEWRSDAVLAGAYFQLHGRNLQGWVYCAPSGAKWLVSPLNIANQVNTSATLTLELLISRFGVLGGVSDERTQFVSLADLGQAEPNAADPSPAGTTTWLQVVDVKPDGSRALIMVFRPVYEFSSSGSHPLHKIPLGWLELAMAEADGQLLASLSVVRTRAQAFGTVVQWVNGDPATQWVRVRPAQQETSVPGDGYTDVTLTPQPLQEGGAGTDVTAWVHSRQQRRQITGRIVAMWYAGSGYDLVTLDMQQEYDETAPAPVETISGSRVERRYTNGTVQVLSDNRVHRLAWAGAANMQSSLTLRLNGALIDSTSTAGELTQQRTASWYDSDRPWSLAITESVEGVATSSGSSTVDGGNNIGDSPMSSFAALCVPYNSPAQAAYYLYGWELYTANNWVQLEICRQSNTLVGFERNKPLAGVRSWGPLSSRTGIHAQTVTPSGLARYGSENPNTGAVTRNQTTPVCHV